MRHRSFTVSFSSRVCFDGERAMRKGPVRDWWPCDRLRLIWSTLSQSVLIVRRIELLAEQKRYRVADGGSPTVAISRLPT